MQRYACGFMVLFYSGVAGAAMDRVYQPYVEQNERELEYGFTWRDLGSDPVLLNRLGVGYAWNDKIFTELYLLTESFNESENQNGEDIGKKQRGYELELKWQLTEQGEYWADWGLLFEAETDEGVDNHAAAVGILWQKELTNNWIGSANGIVEYEFGNDIDAEFETALRVQLRYRYQMALEPAFEIYLDEQDWAAGPALMGAIKAGLGKQLRWNLGLLFGLDQQTPEYNLRGSLEFEF